MQRAKTERDKDYLGGKLKGVCIDSETQLRGPRMPQKEAFLKREGKSGGWSEGEIKCVIHSTRK